MPKLRKLELSLIVASHLQYNRDILDALNNRGAVGLLLAPPESQVGPSALRVKLWEGRWREEQERE